MVEPIKKIEKTEEKNKIAPILPLLEKWNQFEWNGKSGISSLSPSVQSKPFEPSKPVLENPTYKALQFYVTRLEPVVDRYSVLKESEIERDFDRIENLHRDQAVKIEEANKAQKDVTFWGILEDIGSSITSCVSLFFGFSAVSAGAPAIGGALIASGVLSVTNMVFKHTGLWDWTADTLSCGNEPARHAIRTYIPPAVGITSAALGIYGTYAAWSYTALNGIEKGVSLVQSTANVATAITAYGGGMSQYRFKNIAADLETLRSKGDLFRLSLEDCVDDIKEYHERHARIHSTLADIIKETQQTIQIIQQPV